MADSATLAILQAGLAATLVGFGSCNLRLDLSSCEKEQQQEVVCCQDGCQQAPAQL
jgi:hypothetical protein